MILIVLDKKEGIVFSAELDNPVEFKQLVFRAYNTWEQAPKWVTDLYTKLYG